MADGCVLSRNDIQAACMFGQSDHECAPLQSHRVFILSGNYPLTFPATAPLCMWVIGSVSYTNTINELTGSGNGLL
jgi:hypothetical protein